MKYRKLTYFNPAGAYLQSVSILKKKVNVTDY